MCADVQQLAVAVHNHMARVAYEVERQKRKVRAATAAQQTLQEPATAAALHLKDSEAPVHLHIIPSCPRACLQ